jgi:hypothetical protein
MRMGLIAAGFLALAAAPGCWVHQIGGPVLVSLADYDTGEPVTQTPMYAIYYAQKVVTEGTTVDKRMQVVDAAAYRDDLVLGADLPKHWTQGYMYGPGVAWAQHWQIAAEGYEAIEGAEWVYLADKEPREHIVLAHRLAAESIRFESIKRFTAAAKANADLMERDPAPVGLDDTMRRRIVEILLTHYRTWQKRWGQPASRERFYRDAAVVQDNDPQNKRTMDENAAIARGEWEPLVGDAAVAAARLEKMMPSAAAGAKKP